MESKYRNGKIYKISSESCDKYYIGSTYQLLRNRLKKHNDCYNCFQRGTYHFVSSFDIIKYPDHKIELIKLFPCESKTELEKEEGKYQIENAENIINHRVAGRTGLEWRNGNKANKQAYDKERRECEMPIRCDCGKLYYKRHFKSHEKTKFHINSKIKI